MAEGHRQGFQPIIANSDDIKGSAAGGKDTATTFDHQRQISILEKGGEFGGKKLLKTLAEKIAVFTEMTEEIGKFIAVAKVTATLTADTDFPAGFLHFFQEYDFRAPFGGSAGRHQACCAAADDDGSTDLHGDSLPYRKGLVLTDILMMRSHSHEFYQQAALWEMRCKTTIASRKEKSQRKP